MSAELDKFLQEVSSAALANLSEDATKNAVILRLLAALGWNIFDPDEVAPEFVVGNKRVDYCLRIAGDNKVFVECKRASEPLDMHQEQLLNYAFHEGIEVAILTNGLDWWFYLPMNPGSWEQRKFLALQLVEQERQGLKKRLINLLSREQVSGGKALQMAKDLSASNKRDERILASLPKAWSQLIESQDDRLIELVNTVNENICGFRATDEQVAEFIAGMTMSGPSHSPLKNKASIVNKADGLSRTPIESYTGSKPISIQIGQTKIKVESWIGVLEAVCKYLLTKYPNEFAAQVLSLRGTKRPYFSRNRNELRIPLPVANTDLYVEANFSANSIFRLSTRLLVLFENSESLTVQTARK